jgi:hypothetical protein
MCWSPEQRANMDRSDLVPMVAHALWRGVGWPLKRKPGLDDCRPPAEAVVAHLERCNLRVLAGEPAAGWGTHRTVRRRRCSRPFELIAQKKGRAAMP